MKHFLTLLLALFMTGCSTGPIKEKSPEVPEVVQVPVAKSVDPIKFNRPQLATETLPPGSSRETFHEAMIKSLDQIVAYVDFLEGIINSYRTPEMKKVVEGTPAPKPPDR